MSWASKELFEERAGVLFHNEPNRVSFVPTGTTLSHPCSVQSGLPVVCSQELAIVQIKAIKRARASIQTGNFELVYAMKINLCLPIISISSRITKCRKVLWVGFDLKSKHCVAFWDLTGCNLQMANTKRTDENKQIACRDCG